MQNRFKSFIPHIVAILLFFLLSLVYMYPALGGKVITQGDVTQWEGSAHEVMEYKEKTGKLSLWTNSMFGGMPAYQITGNGSKNYIDYLKQPKLPYPADQLFLLLLGGYILFITFRINPWISIVGAVAIAFTTYNFTIIEAGHSTKTYAIAYVPFVLAGINLLFRGRFLAGAALTAVAMALQIEANHMQITYYMFMMLGVWVLAEFINMIITRQFRNFFIGMAIAAVTIAVGIGTSATNLMLTEEYAQQTIRGGTELTREPDGKPKKDEGKKGGLDRDYAFQWSQGWGDLLTIIIPNAQGSGSSVDIGTGSAVYKAIGRNDKQVKDFVAHFPYGYWGALPFTSGPAYFGAIVCLLVVIGIFVLKGPVKWALLVSAALALLLSLGKNFPQLSYFFFDHFPLYNKFRSVNTIHVVAQICCAILAALSLQQLFFGGYQKEQIKKILIRSVSITGGICLLFALFGGMFFDFSKPDENLGQFANMLSEIKEDRQSLLQMDAFRSLVFILLAAGVVWLFALQKIKRDWAIAAVGGLILVDLWSVDKRYLNTENFQPKKVYNNRWVKSPADVEILKDTTHYRVYDASSGSPFMDARASYWHSSMGGYHAAKLRRFQDIFEYQITRNNMRVFNMFNTKYIIDRDNNTGQQFAQMNPYALGNAWFVKELAIVPDADAEMDSLRTFEPAEKAIVDKRFSDYLKDYREGSYVYDSSASIRLTSYAPDRLTYESNSKSNQFAVFSEVYYDKGWQAYLDGKPVEHIRVNYILRAMKVPAGSHQIEFRFEPQTYKKGERISMISNIIVYGLAITALVVAFLRARKEAAAEKPEGKKS